MNHRRRGLVLLVVIVFAALPTAASASADVPTPVDQSRLLPSLSPSFAPWTCRARQGGPVCHGERHISTAWSPFDFGCGDTPLWGRGDSDRYQTRFYNRDYLDTRREFRTHDTDYLSTFPSGPATATVATNVRFTETFAVPGDDRTRTITTTGVLWDIRSARGRAVWRAVGILVEAPDAVGIFSGHVTTGGKTTRFENSPLPDVLSDDTFVAVVCAAATGAP